MADSIPALALRISRSTKPSMKATKQTNINPVTALMHTDKRTAKMKSTLMNALIALPTNVHPDCVAPWDSEVARSRMCR